MKVDIEGSEFAAFTDPGARWLGGVERVVMEVHPRFGAPATMGEVLREAGFRVSWRRPDGGRANPARFTESGGYLFTRRGR